MVRYTVDPDSAPHYQFLSPDQSSVEQKDSLRDLGVMLSSDLNFSLQVEKVVTTASQMVGWGMRTFRGRGSYLLITLFKSLVQPHLDYCGQLWCPSAQQDIAKIEKVQKSLVSRIRDSRLKGLSYWDKLKTLKMYSQERRRERYIVIFIWKVSQGLVTGYDINFTLNDCRTGRKAIPATVVRSAPASVRKARESTLSVRGVQLFNTLPIQLRNSDHGDVEMFKNHLDIYLSSIPDEPTMPGLVRAAKTNSLLDQKPDFDIV